MNPEKNKTLILLACLLLLTPFCYLGYVFYDVTRDASKRVERGAIDRIIASESPVYYDDDETPIGVFFEKTHRKFIHYEEIPKIFIKSVIAAEDGNFFSHNGIDFKAILRAFIVNIRSGRVVQGGSTITQQTAKNIFKREKRSYRAKLRELIQAFLLEREYSKEEILEMYVNQFFVTGYGKGLGIAAQCFFDKDAKDLTLVEAAFIAGSVKGPNTYNPFIKKTDAERNKARHLAKVRKDYVLTNMRRLNFIREDQYREAKNMEVPFKEGKITYRLNVVLDYIREQLESAYFQSILAEQGVSNAFASGISIHTSINREIQKSALLSLRTHLPLLDVNLNGYQARELPANYNDLYKKSFIKSDDSLPFLAKITHIDLENYRLVVTWLKGGGIINYEGMEPMAKAWLKWKTGNSSPWNKKHARSFLNTFHKGDIVPVQLLPSADNKGESRLRLSKIPELEGGIIVLQNGMVKAMTGGFLNRFFNRSVDAKRQLGSIFKPIVYTAALQLNWNSLEPLQNIRDVFEFENTFYLPRPDHVPQSPLVSMEWAGAKSENLATVWLLYHLTDHLNMSEFKEVVNIVGLHRRKDEPYMEYKKRIRDQHGVVVNTETMKKAAFEKSKEDIVSDIIFSGHTDILSNLSRLHFSLDRRKFNPENLDERQILRFSFTRLQNLNLRMKQLFRDISRYLEQYKTDFAPEGKELLSQCLRHFYRTNEDDLRIIYTEEPALLLTDPLIPITLEWLLNEPQQFSCTEVWVDGLFDSKTLDLLQNNTKSNYMTLFAHKRYDPEVLFWVRDFKTLVSLLYVVHLSKQMGISSSLEPVLSFPLGPNSISIAEAALVYQTIMTGKTFPISPGAGLDMIPIIRKIVDREGEVLWEYDPSPVKVLTGRVSGMVTGILRKVMEMGTGKRARDAVRVFGIPIPSFGKTGTSNRFTNSSFVGFIPGSNDQSDRLDILNGYVISSYVGFDDNKPMKAERLAIYGASGALPLWIDTAAAIVSAETYSMDIQPADLVFDPVTDLLSEYGSFIAIPVSPVSGLPVSLSAGTGFPDPFNVFADAAVNGTTLELKRRFEPIPGDVQ